MRFDICCNKEMNEWMNDKNNNAKKQQVKHWLVLTQHGCCSEWGTLTSAAVETRPPYVRHCLTAPMYQTDPANMTTDTSVIHTAPVFSQKHYLAAKNSQQ